MIEELTLDQELLMDTIANQYEQSTLNGDTSYNEEFARRGIDFIYSISDLKPPNIVICSSPIDLMEKAGLAAGENMDTIGACSNSGWTAFYDYMQQIGVEYDKEWGFDIWRDFILKSGVFSSVLFENVAYVCLRPCEAHRTSTGNLHNPNGPAVRWSDGHREYFLNGCAVSQELVMTPWDELSPMLTVTENNAEVRREIVRKIGIERIIQKLGGKVIDTMGSYSLITLDIPDMQTVPTYLKMLNPSIGTWHVEGVHPDCTTVQEALNWRRSGNKEAVWNPNLLT